MCNEAGGGGNDPSVHLSLSLQKPLLPATPNLTLMCDCIFRLFPIFVCCFFVVGAFSFCYYFMPSCSFIFSLSISLSPPFPLALQPGCIPVQYGDGLSEKKEGPFLFRVVDPLPNQPGKKTPKEIIGVSFMRREGKPSSSTSILFYAHFVI